jgi:hypothetical protein
LSHLYFRLAETEDPEERLEDAVLFKALHDEFGDGLTIVPPKDASPEDGLFLGRGKNREFDPKNVIGMPGMQYWEDPAFRNALTRSFIVTDLPGAEAEVKRLHAEGKDAFLKSTKQKHYIGRIDQGVPFHEAMDGMVYSFMDLEDCLMVQEAVEMNFERRFLVMNGKVVTQSPVAWHLTPMSRGDILEETGFSVEDLHYETPKSREARFNPSATERMTKVAQAIADASDNPNLCIDLAIMGSDLDNDPIEVIEFNPMQPGACGLYGCSPKKIAAAVWGVMDSDLRATVEARRDGMLNSAPDKGDAHYALSPEEHAQEMVDNADPFIKSFLGGDVDTLRDDYVAFFQPENSIDFEGSPDLEGEEPWEDDLDFEDDNIMTAPTEETPTDISQDLVRYARNLKDVTSLLLVDDIFQNFKRDDGDTSKQGLKDIAMMTRQASNDPDYRRRLMAWLDDETSTVELRGLFAEALGDGKTYWNDKNVSHRIDIIDSASLHVREHIIQFNEMEDVKKLAVEHGGSFAHVLAQDDITSIHRFCESRYDFMSFDDIRRYDTALEEHRLALANQLSEEDLSDDGMEP